MANKPLLLIKDGMPVILSSVRRMKANGIYDIIIVVSPESPIPYVIDEALSNFKVNVAYAIQNTSSGVCEAMKAAIPLIDDDADYVVISCCDNVYDNPSESIKIPISTDEDAIIEVRNVPHYQAMHLASYNKETKEFKRKSTSPWKVAGMFTFRAKAFKEQLSRPSQPLMSMFNEMRCGINEANPKGWWDVGTLQTYIAYWRAN